MTVLLFREIASSDLNRVGEKALNLAKISQSGLKTSPGFVITSECFEKFLRHNKLQEKIRNIKNSDDLKRLINESKFPEDISEEIIENYSSLGFSTKHNDAASLLRAQESLVSVRCSPIESSDQIKSLNQLNIKSGNKVIDAIKSCYASMLTDSIESKGVAIIVQNMIDSEKSGVSYSCNPEDNSEEIVIKACFGLGPSLSSVYPDIYSVACDSLSIKSTEIGNKEFEIIRDKISDETTRKLLTGKAKTQVIYDKEITEIARLTKKVKNIIGNDVRVEWAIQNNNIFLMDARNVENKEQIKMEIIEKEEDEPEIVDIYEEDIEEDLEALHEIEKIEKEEKVVEQESQTEPIVDRSSEVPTMVQEDTEELIDLDSVEDTENEDKKTIDIDQEELGEDQKEEIQLPEGAGEQEVSTEASPEYFDADKDDSSGFILESIEQEPKEKEKIDPKTIYKNVLFNLGNIIVGCDMAIIGHLKQEYVSRFNQEIHSVQDLVDNLNISNRDNIVKVHEIKTQFLEGSYKPTSEDVILALNTAKSLLD